MSLALTKTTPVTTRVFQSFAHGELAPALWRSLLESGQTNEVFLTREWQSAWWESFGRGKLLLIVAERDEKPIAIAPLFADSGMVFFVGSGGSDYLDFIGDISEPDVLDEILRKAIECTHDFLGFRFYHVPDRSRTATLLAEAAIRLGMKCYEEGDLAAPGLDFRVAQERSSSPANRKSMLRHERALRREGELVVEHISSGETIRRHLNEFFEQHIDRWKATSYPSLFLDPKQREFYGHLSLRASDAGWLRFTRLVWNGRPIAFHFGFSYNRSYLWYKPSFAIDLARHSPGEVLLRQLMLAALAEGSTTFDFGLGDEAFKSRFATHVNHVHTWGLYP
jgi:CelD/BcsL family acetyltransferase involved in cellulose biosynthesis